MSGLDSISSLRKKYKLLRTFETSLFAIAGGSIVSAISFLFLPTWALLIAGVLTSIAIFIIRYNYLKLSAISNLQVAFYLNRLFPKLKESSDLLLKREDQLNTLEKLQLARIEKEVSKAIPDVKLPHHLPVAITTAVFGIALVLLSSSFAGKNKAIDGTVTNDDISQTEETKLADISLESIEVQITPPRYTQLASHNSPEPGVVAPVGSRLEWKLKFNRQPEFVTLHFSLGDSVVNKLSYTLDKTVLYQIQWRGNGKSYHSDYYKLEAKEDAIPSVAINDLPQFTRLKWGEKQGIQVRSTMADDYGLSKGHIIATVSKGSGESVKFREEKLEFTAPSKISGRKISAERFINFQQLGMEPGDEVYFYVEAFDNREPESQRNRTETFFVALQDTAKVEMMSDAGLGVDLMPDYFRSQRQLIIDTEKLLADQKKITKQQFNSTSNELGYDQKVLRLRYGQFLGEEFETSIGESAIEDQEDGEKKDEDVLKKYGHQHDKDNEHNLVADKKAKEGDEHDHEEDKDDPIAAYRHNHDNEESATFFTQSIKAKLRAALTLMWDSELQLRLYHPKESLPYQYQILKLLKEISNDSRIYVHRTGFDPPPLKEEKRLTADLNEISSSLFESESGATFKYPAIRKALNNISNLLQQDSIVLNSETKNQLQSAGNELSAVALVSAGSYLKKLSLLRDLIDGQIDHAGYRPALESLRNTFWQLLPEETASPNKRGTGAHPLDEKLLKELKGRTNGR